jgi:hypothetical protein
MSALAMIHDLRPQGFKSGSPSKVRDPIVEPLWPGLRVLAGIDRSGDEAALTAIVDQAGTRIQDHADIESALAVAARADSLIVDGYLTKQVAHDETGVVPTFVPALPTGTELARSMVVGVRHSRRAEMIRERTREREAVTFGPTDVVALVAVDLLWLDGQPLFDVPLLERKRLLESALDESDVIRLGQFVRPPIESWIGSWRALGFSAITFKAANGRYRPGATADDWTISSMPRR